MLLRLLNVALLSWCSRAPPHPLRTMLRAGGLRAVADAPEVPTAGVAAMLLAFESAGFSAEESGELWERRPPGKLPGPARQVALLEWLQGEFGSSDDAVRASYRCVWREPKLLLRAGALPALRASCEVVASLCDLPLGGPKLANAIVRYPSLLLASGDELRATAAWLRELGELSEEDTAKMLGEAPNLLACKRPAMQARLDWMRDELGIDRGGRLGRVMRNGPLVLTLSVEKTIMPKLGFLRGLGVASAELGPLVVRSPRLLHTPISELDRKVEWLARRGIATNDAG
eukprot:422465-Prymnesium_polylepis.1